MADASMRHRERLHLRFLHARPQKHDGWNSAVTANMEKRTWPYQPRKRGVPSSCYYLPFVVGVTVLSSVALLRVMTSPYFRWSTFSNVDVTQTHPPTSHNLSSGRFPLYGTTAFSRKCPWATATAKDEHTRTLERNCTILVEPRGGIQQEGIAEWVSNIVSWFLISKRAGGCQFKFHYYPNVDLSQVMESTSIIDVDFPCERVQNCYRQSHHSNNIVGPDDQGTPVPQYRVEYFDAAFKHKHVHGYEHLRKRIPTFSLESGMACAWGSLLLRLSPSAVQFEPLLFDKILPALHDPSALVLALYIRTGHTDEMATAEERGNVAKSDRPDTAVADAIMGCALQLEEEYWNSSEPAFTKLVWLLVSDSPATKEWIVQKYGHRAVGLPARGRTNGNPTIPTEIVTTQARGIHTRGRRDPSTRDFAEAFLDWYLLGESDLVISHGGYSFGATAALRTARPLYRSPVPFNSPCTKAILVNQEGF